MGDETMVRETRELPVRIGELEWAVIVPAELPVDSVELVVRVSTEDELRRVVAAVGGIERFGVPASTTRLLAIYSTNDIEDGIPADLRVWLVGEDFEPVPQPIVPAIVRLLAEAKERRAQRGAGNGDD